MLHVIVYGFPKTSQKKLAKCCQAIRATPGHVSGVQIPPHRVAVSFLVDQFNLGLGEEVLVYVHGLSATCLSPPTREQKYNLCHSIVVALQNHKPRNCKFIQVRTCQADPEEGYSEG
ncbi:MAG: hypothetical protein UW34_C0001G0056 [Parcubacteria group bacterium GW2011_GWA2_44_15]|nr:MAG: hypothetical protein UW34_C0001G0056 [Parcubacteria group bacterium GW2011_GWA2_44_15]